MVQTLQCRMSNLQALVSPRHSGSYISVVVSFVSRRKLKVHGTFLSNAGYAVPNLTRTPQGTIDGSKLSISNRNPSDRKDNIEFSLAVPVGTTLLVAPDSVLLLVPERPTGSVHSTAGGWRWYRLAFLSFLLQLVLDNCAGDNEFVGVWGDRRGKGVEEGAL